MANTVFQIKRSTATAAPTSLQYGELAYSFQSGRLYLGNSTNAVVCIGGNTYNQIVDAATNLNTVSTIVKRDGSGNFAAGTITAALSGNATTATTWQTARNLTLTGDATANIANVNGSADVSAGLTLATVNSNVGTFGGGTNMPSFTVDGKGRITAASNVAISTSFIIANSSSSQTFNNGSTLSFLAGSGLTSTLTTNTITYAVDSTVLRNTGTQTLSGSLTVTGDLFVEGNTTTIDVGTLVVEDSLIKLANNNIVNDSVDIGFYGSANPGVLGYYGIARVAANNGNFFVFKGLPNEPTGNAISSASITTANTGTLWANLTGGTVSNLGAAISAADGGTGQRSYTTGDLLYASGATTLSKLSDVATGNVLISGGVGTAPSWGKVDLTAAVSGILPIANGGTNSNATPTLGGIVYGTGTAHAITAAGTLGQAIVSNAGAAPTWGTLDLRGGGLGITSLNANSVPYYVSGNALTYTSTATDGQVLQFATAGGIQFGMLDGGSF
jgi:hypothetical protein